MVGVEELVVVVVVALVVVVVVVVVVALVEEEGGIFVEIPDELSMGFRDMLSFSFEGGSVIVEEASCHHSWQLPPLPHCRRTSVPTGHKSTTETTHP